VGIHGHVRRRSCRGRLGGAGAAGFLSTQASTKVYRSAEPSSQDLEADVGSDGLLVLWPDPVVCFAGSAYSQQQVLSLAESASLLAVDWLASGRRAAGERWAFRSYTSRLIVRRAGRLLVHESLRLDPESGPVAERLGRFNHLAVVVLTGPRVAAAAARLCTELSGAPVVERSDLLLSCSPLPSGAVLRLAAADMEHGRRTLAGLLGFLPDLLGDDPWTRKW
jgi:urease accessory protein